MRREKEEGEEVKREERSLERIEEETFLLRQEPKKGRKRCLRKKI